MITIKHRYSDTTQREFDVESVKQAAEKGKVNLREADLSEADLSEADLSGANLRRANLYGANLRGANLYGANLYGANLRGANLRGANLYGANLYGANLRGANLYGANLYGANLYGANLRGAIIDGEKISKNPTHITCGLQYVALITDGYMRLGCKRFTHAEWAAFSDDEISAMDNGALEFWLQWKAPLMAMCDAHRGVVLIKE